MKDLKDLHTIYDTDNETVLKYGPFVDYNQTNKGPLINLIMEEVKAGRLKRIVHLNKKWYS